MASGRHPKKDVRFRRWGTEAVQVDRCTPMAEQAFIIYFEGPEMDDEALDRFFEAGCDDATFGVRNGRHFADFDREAESLGDAVASAVEDLTASDPAVRITGFQPADPVSQSAIAERAGLSREAIRLIAAGERGAGDFPMPLHFSGRAPLYSWAESHRWLLDHGYRCGEGDSDSEIALESVSELLRFHHLRKSWTARTRLEAERIAEALPEKDFLRPLLAGLPAEAERDE